ncbi:MAG: hypothetical protein KJ655_06060, partial [Candidatus Thermoplasmatota archaeon]|nr:hypothetical protein [Candidatus Thermoplasmatota archaeon]
QQSPEYLNRKYKEYREKNKEKTKEYKEYEDDDKDLKYFVKAKEGDCVILLEDKRIIEINGMGRDNIWYAKEAKDLKRKVIDFIGKN